MRPDKVRIFFIAYAIFALVLGCGPTNNYGFKENDMGNMYFDQGQYDKAIDEYTKVINDNGIHDEWGITAYKLRARAYAQKGQYDLAIADYAKIIELPFFKKDKQELAELYNLRASWYRKLGNIELAERDIIMVRVLQPNKNILLNQTSGEPLHICVNLLSIDKENEEAIYKTFRERPASPAQYPITIKKASSMQESIDYGCDIYVIEKASGTTSIEASVANVYSNEILLAFRSNGSDQLEAMKKIGSYIIVVFAPGTANFNKITLGRRESSRRTQLADTSKQNNVDTATANYDSSTIERRESRRRTQRADVSNQNNVDTAAVTNTSIEIPTFNSSQITMGEKNYAIIIGIEKYQNVPKSDYSSRDANLVKKYVRALGIPERNIEFIVDERASFTAIKKSIEAWLPNHVKKDSRVIVYYSGHGAPDISTADAYLVPYDGDPNYLQETAYPVSRMYEQLGKLDASEIIVLMDACFTGGGGRSILPSGARPLVMVRDSEFKSDRIAVFTSTQKSQISVSSPEKGHGLFTYYFVDALNHGKRNVAEIYEYMKPLVEDEAKSMNISQSPDLKPGIDSVKGRFALIK